MIFLEAIKIFPASDPYLHCKPRVPQLACNLCIDINASSIAKQTLAGAK